MSNFEGWHDDSEAKWEADPKQLIKLMVGSHSYAPSHTLWGGPGSARVASRIQGHAATCGAALTWCSATRNVAHVTECQLLPESAASVSETAPKASMGREPKAGSPVRELS